MKLSLRSFKTTIILHVLENVTSRDVDVLIAGLPKIAMKHLPLIIDFEKSFFKEDSYDRLERLTKQLKESGMEIYIVSARLKEANAKSFEMALQLSANPNKQVILEVIALEQKLLQMETEQEELLKKTAETSESTIAYKSIQKENERLQTLVNYLTEAVERDTLLYRTFSAQVNAQSPILKKMKKAKTEVLDYMAEKGISFSKVKLEKVKAE